MASYNFRLDVKMDTETESYLFFSCQNFFLIAFDAFRRVWHHFRKHAGGFKINGMRPWFQNSRMVETLLLNYHLWMQFWWQAPYCQLNSTMKTGMHDMLCTWQTWARGLLDQPRSMYPTFGPFNPRVHSGAVARSVLSWLQRLIKPGSISSYLAVNSYIN